MTFIERSLPNGDRDLDVEEEYDIAENKQEKNLVSKAIDRYELDYYLPQCFDDDYYNSRISSYHLTSKKQYFLWLSLNKYKDAIFDFYLATMKEFKQKSGEFDLEEFVCKAKQNKESLEELADRLKQAEMGVFKSLSFFYVKTESLDDAFFKKFKDNKTIMMLSRYGAKAWMMYHNLKEIKEKSVLERLQDFQKDFETAHLNNPLHVANVFIINEKTKTYINNHIKPFWKMYIGDFGKINSTARELYKHNDPVELYNELIMESHGYSSTNNDANVTKLAMLTKDKQAKKIISFFSNYADMKQLLKKLKETEKINVKTDFGMFTYEEKNENTSRDIFITAENYKLQCEKLFDVVPKDLRMYLDLVYFDSSFEQVLENNKENHSYCKLEMERLSKQLNI